jgi:DNA-binding MarR family transcriptional regulator
VLFAELTRWRREVAGAVDRGLRERCAVTLAEYRLLEAVARLGPCRSGELKAFLAAPQAEVVSLTERAVARGLCLYDPGEARRDAQRISLSPGGVSVLQAADRVVEDEFGLLTASLPSAAVSRAREALTRLQAASQAVNTGNLDLESHQEADPGWPSRLSAAG